MKKYRFYTDAGHGWLAVKRNELKELGLLSKISSYSYEKGNTVYLEEDCDASLFIAAKKAKGEEVAFVESHVSRSPIRSYNSFFFQKENA